MKPVLRSHGLVKPVTTVNLIKAALTLGFSALLLPAAAAEGGATLKTPGAVLSAGEGGASVSAGAAGGASPAAGDTALPGAASAAPATGTAAGAAAAPAAGPRKAGSMNLDFFENLILSRRKAVPETPLLSEADLAAAALARIRATRPLLRDKPDAETRQALLMACSLATEAAVAQLEARRFESQVLALSRRKDSTLRALNQTHAEILRLERGYATGLKADLDGERRKAKDRQDEAERRFGELQSALIQVSKDARGTIISMSDILFDVGKATLTSDLKTSLAKIAGILTIYKEPNVLVEGHTDNQGSADFNQKLSEKRAGNVMDFLVSQGIDSARLSAAGYGFQKPIADNATKEGRQKNRRVDLVVQDRK